MKHIYFNLSIDERGIATLAFDTPNSAVNVLCFDALYELEELLNAMKMKQDIRVLFIESAKEDIFIAGADINEIKAFNDETKVKEMLSKGQAIFNLLESLPFITVAVIDGACLGGGLELALACNYRIATNDEHTRIGLVEVSLGIIPGLGGTQRLVPLVGFSKAIELTTASKRLKGDKALKLGAVDASVPSGYLEFKKEEFVKEILSGMLDHKIQEQRKGVKWYERFAAVRTIIAKTAHRQIEAKTGGHYPAPLKVVEVLVTCPKK